MTEEVGQKTSQESPEINQKFRQEKKEPVKRSEEDLHTVFVGDKPFMK